LKIDGLSWKSTLSRRRRALAEPFPTAIPAPTRLGLALGGGFARGDTHVIPLHLPMQVTAAMPTNMFHVINRCFQILHSRTQITWRQNSDLVIEPDVREMERAPSTAPRNRSRPARRPPGWLYLAFKLAPVLRSQTAN